VTDVKVANKVVTRTDYTSFNGTAGQYFYDGDVRRVKKIDSSGTTVFVYNVSGQLIAEYHSDPLPTPAGGGGTSYLTSDHLGSTRVVTKSDGTVKARYDYLPFGEEISSTVGGRSSVSGYGGTDSTKQKFTQKERDIESGLDYFLARYYSSAQGRFTSPDPGNAGATRKDPQSWNGYSYSRNNPLKYVDPDGLTYKLTDLNGNSIDDYSDDDFNQNFRRNKSINLTGGKIYQNGVLIGYYERPLGGVGRKGRRPGSGSSAYSRKQQTSIPRPNSATPYRSECEYPSCASRDAPRGGVCPGTS
jgi:RHS repeat-associated protein